MSHSREPNIDPTTRQYRFPVYTESWTKIHQKLDSYEKFIFSESIFNFFFLVPNVVPPMSCTGCLGQCYR